MSNSATVTFQRALELVEELPEEQQQDLFEIVRSRQRERRREALAASIEQARRELAQGEVQGGTVDDLRERADWIELSKRGLARAYGGSEPEYSIADVVPGKEPIP